MWTLQLLKDFLPLAGLLATALFVLATYKRFDREQQKEINDNWISAVSALKSHNDALEETIQDMGQRQSAAEATATQLKVALAAAEVALAAREEERRLLVATHEKDNLHWARRNTVLFELVQEYRLRLKALGQETPEPDGHQ